MLRWWHWAASIVAFEYSVALLIGWSVGFVYHIPVLRTGLAGLGVALIGTLGFAFVRTAWFASIGEQEPVKRLRRELAAAPDFPILIMLLSCQMAVLAWLKVTMPHAVGFWADPLLAELDAAIFGADPWSILHRAPDWAGALVDRIYGGWAFMGLFILMTLAFSPQSAKRDRALIAYFLIICLAGVSQYLLPSAGPIFYDAVGHGPRFADLPVKPWVEATAEYLWGNYTGETQRVGGGISAMPSVHVATAAWIALTLRAFFPRLQPIGWLYWAAIYFGSVYLGWHYAVDGLAGFAIAALAWRLASLTQVKRQETVPALA